MTDSLSGLINRARTWYKNLINKKELHDMYLAYKSRWDAGFNCGVDIEVMKDWIEENGGERDFWPYVVCV